MQTLTFRFFKFRTMALIGGIFLILLGAYYWIQYKHSFLQISSAFLEAESIVIHSDIAGKVTEIGPLEGDIVKKNQRLFVVDQDFILIKQAKAKNVVEELEKQIALEKEKIGDAMDAYLMATTEMELGIGSMEEVTKHLQEMDFAQEKTDLALKKLQEAKANLDLLDLQLQKMTVSSPFDGIILKKTKNLGSVVSFGDPVYVVCNHKNVWVEAEILETDLSSVTLGTPAKIRLAAYPKNELSGKVSYIGAATVAKSSFTLHDRKIQTIPIKITIDPSPLSLKPGLSASVQLKVR